MTGAAMPNESDRVLSTIPNVSLKAGFLGLGSRLHMVVFTPDRVIFARLTTAHLRELSSDLRAEAKAQGKGRMAQYAAQSHGFEVLDAAYRTMTPAQILAEHPKNFAVDRATITRVKFKRTTDANGDTSTDVLVIKTTGHTYKLTLMSSVNQARQALAAAGVPVV
jgi:hypothetical protein